MACRRVVVKRFKVQRPKVRQSPTAMLDMEEAGAYLLADVVGLPIIPQKYARSVGADVRKGGDKEFKDELSDAKKEAGRLAGRRGMDAQDRRTFVDGAARRVHEADPGLKLPTVAQCAAVVAAEKRRPPATTPAAPDDWKARGWRKVEPPPPEERPPTEMELFLEEDFAGEQADAEAEVQAAQTLLVAAKNKCERKFKSLKKLGPKPSVPYLLGTDLKKMSESVREKREMELQRWDLAQLAFRVAVEEFNAAQEEADAADERMLEARAKYTVQQRARAELEEAERRQREAEEALEAARVEKVYGLAAAASKRRLLEQSTARVAALEEGLQQLRVELAVAEAEADVQRAPQIAHAAPAVQGEAVHVPAVEGVPMDCEEDGIAMF